MNGNGKVINKFLDQRKAVREVLCKNLHRDYDECLDNGLFRTVPLYKLIRRRNAV